VVAAGVIIGSGFFSNNLKSRIRDESIDLGKQINNLRSQDISNQQWKLEKQYQDALQADANSMLKLARQTTQRQLLSYKIFPEPKDTSTFIFEQFGQQYRKGIEDMMKDYGARQSPTPVEIEAALRRTGTADGVSGSLGQTRRDFSLQSLSDVERMIVDELCQLTASNASFYASPLDIAGYEFWGPIQPESTNRTGSTPRVYKYESIEQSVELCWYWQLGYWIIEDVFKTVATMNDSCNNVLDCPVKRIVKVNFDSQSQSSRGNESSVSIPPSYLTSVDDGFTLSHTERVSDEDYDVVHFRVTVLMKAQAVMDFMDELCSAKEHIFEGWFGDKPSQTFMHNQITILETNVNPVVVPQEPLLSTDEHQLYRYGDDAVVEVELICEYVFDKTGYEQVKPEFSDETEQEER
jgi:hypothetical protein